MQGKRGFDQTEVFRCSFFEVTEGVDAERS